MVEYRLRTPFRIGAWFPGLLALGFGVGILWTTLHGPGAARDSILGTLFGVFLCAAGLFFVRIGWTGRVPAFVEEYGLDGPGEVENSRAEARRQGRLQE